MDLATAVTAVRTAVDRLSRVDSHAATATALRRQLSELKTTQSLLDAQLARLTHQADASGAWIGTGARDTADWLAKETGTSSHRNRAAASLGEAMSKSDHLNEAVVSGHMSADKANAAVGAAGDRPLDDDIVSQIADLPLNGVRPATEAWRALLDADRDRDIARSQRSRRFLRLTGQADGMTRVEGLLDPESAAIVRATLDSVINESAFDTSGRSRDQRCADAFTQLATAASKGDISGGRSNARLLVTVPFETVVERGNARGRTHVGPTIDAATVRKMACDAGIHRVINLCAFLPPPSRGGAPKRLDHHWQRPRVHDPPPGWIHRGQPATCTICATSNILATTATTATTGAAAPCRLDRRALLSCSCTPCRPTGADLTSR